MTGAAEPSCRLIATDLDGTLLRQDQTVSARTRAALAAATAAGAAHIVVTGRAVPHTRRVLEALDYDGLAVCGQGAEVYHAGEHRLLTSVTLDRSVARLALTKIEAETGPLALCCVRSGLDGVYLADRGFSLDWDGPDELMRDRDDLWAEPLSKIFIQHPVLGDDDLAQAARDAAGGTVEVVRSGEGIIEVLPLGLSKATGLSLAARRLGVRAAETIAFGDMPNDIPMFRWAAYGVAMANAHAELKEIADEVTASNEDDGIAQVLERIFPVHPRRPVRR